MTAITSEVDGHGERDRRAREDEPESDRDGDRDVGDQRDRGSDYPEDHLVDRDQNRAKRLGGVALEP